MTQRYQLNNSDIVIKTFYKVLIEMLNNFRLYDLCKNVVHC